LSSESKEALMYNVLFKYSSHTHARMHARTSTSKYKQVNQIQVMDKKPKNHCYMSNSLLYEYQFNNYINKLL